MAINYRLEIVGLEVYPHTASLDNVVYNVFSRYWGEASDISGSVVEVRPLSTHVSMPSGDFIPFGELTQDVVAGWVSQEVNFESLQSDISQSIAKKQLPRQSEVLPAPWVG
jgi:hypothetical protein